VFNLKKSLKSQISKVLGSNNQLNKNVIRIKKSWDEIAEILGANKKKPKG